MNFLWLYPPVEMGLARPRRRDAAHLGMSIGSVLAIVGVLHILGHLNPTTAAVCMLVAILVTATVARLAVAVISSMVAMLALNFFFFPPLYTFRIDEAQNWTALTAFLIVSVIASQFLSERKDADLTRQRADLASTLLASLSHDLRTPLTAVSVAVENLQDAALPIDQRQTQARLAAQELDRLKRLFRNILDMARIDASALALDRDWVTAADVVDAAIENLRPSLDERVLEIDADGSTAVAVDPRLTSAALSHLIENAAQYSPADGPIAIRGWVGRDGLHLTVRDHGPGLDPQELERVFERFYRGQSMKSQGVGSGMGLAITRGLLTAEAGRVWGENAIGGGAQFSIVVPGASHAVTTAD